MKKINIAIDGYSSCGKSTLAKQLAQELGYVYVDSGAMYRAITLFAIRKGFFTQFDVNAVELIKAISQIHIHLSFDSISQRQSTFLNNENIEEEIRKMEVSQRVSQVAVIKEVRERLVFLQQEMAKQKGVVMDGRDIGTVVLPHAELKIFMTASHDVRVKRRLDELLAKGEKVTFSEISENLKHRDYLDENRTESPLRKAKDAKILDNSHLDRIQQLDLVKSWVQNSTRID